MDATLLEVFSLPFMGRALATLAVLAVAAGIVGIGISFRELEFVSDALVHAVFPGLVIGAALGGAAGVLPGAAVAALAAAGLFTALDRGRGGPGGDATIAVVLTGLFSLGVVLVSRQDGYVSEMQGMLFGHLLTVTEAQFWQIVVVSAIAAILMLATLRAQLFRAFDPAGFEAAGFRPRPADLVLTIAIALLVVAGAQALGVLMVLALLTVPMAVARLVTRRLGLLVPVAIAVPLLSGALGLWWSFEWSVGSGASVPPGAVVVLLLVGVYALAVVARVGVRAWRLRSRAGRGLPRVRREPPRAGRERG